MPDTLPYRIYQNIWLGLDWLYPPSCAGCGHFGYRWCSGCNQKVKLTTSPLCPICGQMQPSDQLCMRCTDNNPPYTALRSWAVFGGEIRNAILRLKYKRDIALGEVLARPMISLLRLSQWSIDMVIPVPLSLARLAERGYNQAALLARPIALYFNIPYRPKILRKIRETRSQVGLSIALRRENVIGAFYTSQAAIAGKNILVVDDVTTSGSTLEACAESLREAGAEKVYCLTLARAAYAPVGDR